MNILKDKEAEEVMPELKDKTSIENNTTVYICKNFCL